MAHECILCGSDCYCSGDIDDGVLSQTPPHCHTCGCEDREEWEVDFDDEGETDSWEEMQEMENP